MRAWLNLCPHAGRRLDWAPGRFLRSKAGDLVFFTNGGADAIEHAIRMARLTTGKPGKLVEFNDTTKIFENPDQKETEDYIAGRFG